MFFVILDDAIDRISGEVVRTTIEERGLHRSEEFFLALQPHRDRFLPDPTILARHLRARLSASGAVISFGARPDRAVARRTSFTCRLTVRTTQSSASESVTSAPQLDGKESRMSKPWKRGLPLNRAGRARHDVPVEDLACAALIVTASSALCVTAANAQAGSATKAKQEAKPAASPGWLIIEEDFFVPLRFEPLYSLDSIRYHYRRNEEKSAANEIDKAASWLKLAAGHAMPITKEKLTTAERELTALAKDLRAGSITSAANLDGSLAKAASALAEWHYFKAKE